MNTALQIVAPILALAGVLVGARLTSRSQEVTWLRDLRLDRYMRMLQQIDATNEAFDGLFETLSTPEAFPDKDAWESDLNEKADTISSLSEQMNRDASEFSLFSSGSVRSVTHEVLTGYRDILSSIGGAVTGDEAAQSQEASQSAGAATEKAPETEMAQKIAAATEAAEASADAKASAHAAQAETPTPADSGGHDAGHAPSPIEVNSEPKAESRNEPTEEGSRPRDPNWPPPSVTAMAQSFAKARDSAMRGFHIYRMELLSVLRADLGVDVVPGWRR